MNQGNKNSKDVSSSQRSSNDQRSDVKNPNSQDFKQNTDNRSNQMNPNNPSNASNKGSDQSKINK